MKLNIKKPDIKNLKIEKGDYGKVIKIILIALVVIVALVIGIRLIIQNTHKETKTSVVVKVEAPQHRDIAVYTKQIGTVSPAESVNVLAMMSGEILEVHFEPGQKVKKDDVLMVINSDALKSLEIAVNAAKISMEDAQTNLERTKVLYAAGAVSQAGLEQAESAAEGAKLQYDSAVQNYETQKKYSNIAAPISGTVQYKNGDVHDFAQQGQPVAVITADGKNEVTFGVSEDSLNAIEKGDVVYVSKSGYESTGTITEINNMIGQSGLYNVKATLDAEGGITNNSRVVVDVLKHYAEGTLTIPISAVYHSGDDSFVYILTNDNKAEKREFVPGIYDEDYIEVLSGIEENENVIYTWSKELYDKAEVVVNYK